MTSDRKWWITILVAVAAIPTWVYAGYVFDETTARPIPGAFIVVTWEGQVTAFVESRSVCYRLDVAQSDAAGRFSISPVSGNLNPLILDLRQDTTVVARGYKVSASWKPDSEDIPMLPSKGTPSERFESLPHGIGGCRDEDEKKALPVLKALHEYKSELASTPKEQDEVRSLMHQIETIEFGEKEASRRYEERRQSVLRETQIASSCTAYGACVVTRGGKPVTEADAIEILRREYPNCPNCRPVGTLTPLPDPVSSPASRPPS